MLSKKKTHHQHDSDQPNMRAEEETVAESPSSTSPGGEEAPLERLGQEVAALKEQLQRAQDGERRAIADYQNLVRRTQEDRVRIIKMAGKELLERLLQPLEHLYLAKEQLKDQGLNMVYGQFQQALREEGVEEIEVLGKEFDYQTMEVVGKKAAEKPEHVGKVVAVQQRGYTLNGEVIRHAKVVIGE